MMMVIEVSITSIIILLIMISIINDNNKTTTTKKTKTDIGLWVARQVTLHALSNINQGKSVSCISLCLFVLSPYYQSCCNRKVAPSGLVIARSNATQRDNYRGLEEWLDIGLTIGALFLTLGRAVRCLASKWLKETDRVIKGLRCAY